MKIKVNTSREMFYKYEILIGSRHIHRVKSISKSSNTFWVVGDYHLLG